MLIEQNKENEANEPHNEGEELNVSQDNEDQDADKIEHKVPYHVLKKSKQEAKELKEKLDGLLSEKKKAQEMELLEQNKLKELVDIRDQELNALRSEVEAQKNAQKAMLIKNEITKHGLKMGAHDPEDILVHLNMSEIESELESQDFSSFVDEKIREIKQAKPYLFSLEKKQVSPNQNLKPSSVAIDDAQNASTYQPSEMQKQRNSILDQIKSTFRS